MITFLLILSQLKKGCLKGLVLLRSLWLESTYSIAVDPDIVKLRSLKI